MTLRKTKYSYPKDGSVRIQLSPKTHKKIFDLAAADGRGVKAYVEQLCEKCKK